MTLKLFNTLTKSKDQFVPIDDRSVRMYVCGPTVYDRAHIGNARPVIVFDLLYRLLRHTYGADHVFYVRNITDVDDKINARAAERGVSIRTLTEETAAVFRKDVADLGCLPPTTEPRATEHIDEMKAIIERLIARGYAYVAEDHVLFSVKTMEEDKQGLKYGALARRSLDEMLAGARVDVAPYKRDAMDFVLWKPSPEGTPSWPSPAGIAAPGRPGWHIECSAMAWKHLVDAFAGRLRCDDASTNTFDIHGGGIDLVFPHHENEIAQSCCAFDTERMANVWMHNGFLQVEGEKMSKSLGNFITIGELLADWPGDVIRLAMLQTHYRQPINWTLKGLEEAEKMLTSWFDAASEDAEPRPAAEVVAALSDDLNTPKAIAEMHALRSRAGHKSLGGTLAFLGFRPDLLGQWQDQRRAARELALPVAEIESLIEARLSARRSRDFAEADRIRNDLAAQGIVLKDGPDGTTWEAAK
jgi:cysteinyl-tRNA synthetase